MFRRRRRPTPQFKIPPPYNPIQGENASLRQEGVSPFCAMMQVAAEDVYDNYVICRGFDPRILKFIDYAAGDPNKPGICVAKPFGKRLVGTYAIGEVYPAFLPTQGNAGFMDFRQVTYVPPSPTAVNWRVGQNPGVVADGQGTYAGQPEFLTDSIEILVDHNGKVINWLLIDSKVEGGRIQGPIITASSSGMNMLIEGTNSSLAGMIGTEVRVEDLSGCILDMDYSDAVGVWVWAEWQVSVAFPSGAWTVFNRCCIG